MPDNSVILPNLLADRAAKTPDRVFLQHVNGAECTFGELDPDRSTVGRGAGIARGQT